MSPRVHLTLRLLAALGLASCGSGSSGAPHDEPGSVRFRVEEVSSIVLDGIPRKTWLATHERDGKLARFRIELKLAPPKPGSFFSMTTGALHREAESQPEELLKALAAALDAKRAGPVSERRNSLSFSVAILGQNLSRGGKAKATAGSFSSNPPGGWMATKIFLADGEGEVFLNLNPAQGVGEFSIKDSEYGDIVLRELAKVL